MDSSRPGGPRQARSSHSSTRSSTSWPAGRYSCSRTRLLPSLPAFLQPFVDAIPLELSVLLALGAAALITRYRRGDRVERIQVRWLVSAVSVCIVGAAATAVEYTVGGDSP